MALDLAVRLAHPTMPKGTVRRRSAGFRGFGGMIITRSPLRISIGGGGTDLASYYREHGGFLVAMAISKHVYISLHRRFDSGALLRYSQIEHVEAYDEICHPIIRECLRVTKTRTPNLEITSMADVPAGTGLGSSGSFTTALLKALHIHHKRHIDMAALAELACHIEIERLKEPIGKQDQYIAAFGGLTAFTFERDGAVGVETLEISDETHEDLDENLVMFFTGRLRSASAILQEQHQKSKDADPAMIANLHRVKELGWRTRDAFLKGDLRQWGEIMREHWETKKKRSSGMSNPQIDEYYELALRNGAIGGKLVGAGGGGFLLFYAEDPRRLRATMSKAGLNELFFHIDVEGTRVVTR
jgi:D-glycero-alpha-D-manno-heptose-7-phosphate kinase